VRAGGRAPTTPALRNHPGPRRAASRRVCAGSEHTHFSHHPSLRSSPPSHPFPPTTPRFALPLLRQEGKAGENPGAASGRRGVEILAGGLRLGGLELVACYWRLTSGTVHSPLTTHHSPLTTHHSPLTTHHSPLTTHHSPLTTHHSPLTTHHSPLTTHRSPDLAALGDSLAHVHDALETSGAGEAHAAAPSRARQGAHGRGLHEPPAFLAALDLGGVFGQSSE
jgi:hypothetical protein